MNAKEWALKLGLEPHQEGGYFKETYAALEKTLLNGNERSCATSILFLLTASNPSRLHRLKSDEVWYYHTGHNLTVHLLHDNGTYEAVKLGLGENELLQFTVPRGVIFGSSIESNNPNDFAIVSCHVSPGFDYNDFELFTQDELIKDYPQHEAIIRQMAFEKI